MGWVLRLVETGVEGSSRSVDVMAIDRPGDLGDIAALGLTLAQGTQLVALVQQEIVTAQSRDHGLWCINWVSAAGWSGYGGSPAAESSHAVQAQRTAPSQNSERQVQSFELAGV